MSLTFAPLARLNGGAVKVILGTGVVAETAIFQGFKINDVGAIHSVLDGVIDHYASGLPFDVHGRLVISNDVPERVTMSVPFNAAGAVAGSQ